MQIVKMDKVPLLANEFLFYLDAWLHCYKNRIDLNRIQRKNWQVWQIVD